MTDLAVDLRSLSQQGLEPSRLRQCRRKFLRFFPDGFADPTYDAWERGYKLAAHQHWTQFLSEPALMALLQARDYAAIAQHAVRLESRTNLLFSFEKMALRDALKSPQGAKRFATALHDFLHGEGTPQSRFEAWVQAVADLPRRQTRVLTWPVVTVFGFLAQPRRHLFFKPNVTRRAAELCGVDLPYASRPNWTTYSSLLRLAAQLRRDLADLRPRDLIDIQSFLWVQGSDEYA